MTLLLGEYPITDFVNCQLITAPSLLSFPCTAWINCQPSTKLTTDWSKSQSYFMTGGLPSNSSSWRLAPKIHDQRYHFLFQLNPCSHSPYVTYSLMRRWVCLLWICLDFLQVYILHIYQVTELVNLTVFKITPQHGLHWKHCSPIVASVSFCRNVFTELLLRNKLHNPIVLLWRACMLQGYLAMAAVYRVTA
jgi:hypothetical protein